MAPIRQPLENCSMTEVLVRVSYHLAVMHYRRSAPWGPGAAPSRVHELGEDIRAQGFINLYWTLNGCARWLASGYTLGAWRSEASTLSGVRAFHKRSSARARR